MSNNSHHPYQKAIEAFARDLQRLDSATAHAVVEKAREMARAKLRRFQFRGDRASRNSSCSAADIAKLQTTARELGYEGEACRECQNFTLVRNGTCSSCDTCGSTSGCN